MTVGDFGPHRQKYATEKQMNESHSVLIVHPIKARNMGVERLVNEWQRTWNYLRRAPYQHRPVMESRITFHANDSRPLTERLFSPRVISRYIGTQSKTLV